MLSEAMSNNSELVRTAYEVWNRDDLDPWLETLHPDVEWHTSGVFPDLDPVYRGHKGAAELWRQMREPWEMFHIDVEQIDEEERDSFVVTVRFRAKGVDSGAGADMRFANAIRLQDNLIIEVLPRRTVEEARKALHQRQPTMRRERSQ
jgi:ketosteroid isomerase-like protein